MKIKNRSPLLLLAVLALAVAAAAPCSAQTALRLSPHSVSFYDPVRGTCTIMSADDGPDAAFPGVNFGTPGHADQFAGILVNDDTGTAAVAAATPKPDYAFTSAAVAAARTNGHAHNIHTRRGRTVARNRRARDASTDTAAALDPPPAPGTSADALPCYTTVGFSMRLALLPDDFRQLVPNPERRGEQRDLHQTVRASSHPEDKTDPYAADRPAYTVRI